MRAVFWKSSKKAIVKRRKFEERLAGDFDSRPLARKLAIMGEK